jgi:hypothetical protein
MVSGPTAVGERNRLSERPGLLSFVFVTVNVAAVPFGRT